MKDIVSNSITSVSPGIAWLEVVKSVYQKGLRFNNTREITNLYVVIETPTIVNQDIEDMYYRIVPKSSIERVQSTMFNEGKYRGKTTYWSKLTSWQGEVNQIQQVVDRIAQTPGSKHLSCTVLDPKQDWKKHGYMNIQPCLSSMEFRVRNGKLHLTALFRSQDVFKIGYIDYIALRDYSRKVIEGVQKKNPVAFSKLEVGSITSLTVTAFIYRDDFPLIHEMLKKFSDFNL